MMCKPLVTIVVPVYNVEDYLEECVESIIIQNYKNIEIILINDGSTDRSLKILKKYQKENQNIKLISHSNQGQSYCRNIGINLSEGKYILFLDSDDYILPNAVSSLVSKAEKYNLDLVRFAGESFTDDNFNYLLTKYNYNEYFVDKQIYSRQEHLSTCVKTFAAMPCLYLIKKEVLVKNNIKFKNSIIHEDELFTLEVFLYSNNMMYDSSTYYRRRYRSNSVMTSISSEKLKYSFDSYCEVISSMDNLLNKFNNEKEASKIIKHRRIITFRVLLNTKIPIKYKFEKLVKIKGITLTKKLSECVYFYIKKITKIIFRKLGLLNLASQCIRS